MGDQASIEVMIAANVDRLLAGMGSFERSLASAEKASGAAGAAAVQHGNTLTALEGKVGSLTGSIGRLVNIGTGFAIFEAIKSGLAAFSGLEQFNIDIAHTTSLLQGNATAGSTWMQISSLMDISVNTIERSFAALSKNLNAVASPALKEMGISAESANGKLRSLNDVINQAADYFHAHAGASNNAALANQLFGRSGVELLPILEQGSAGLNNITEEARKYGLVLSVSAIQSNLQFTYQLKEAEMAVRGLGISVGNALLPGLAALAGGLSNIIQQNLPAFVAAIQRTVAFILGLVEGLTGMTFKIDQSAIAMGTMASATGDLGTGLDAAAPKIDKTGAAAARLAAEQRKITDAAKDATAAIDDQIRALTARQEATKFSDTQTALKQKSEDEQLNITKLSADKQLALFLGNAVQAKQIDEQLVAAKEQNAATQLSITRGVEDQATKLKIAALDAQKTAISDAAANQIQKMQDAAKATEAAMQQAGAGSVAAMGGAFAQLPPLADKAGKSAGDALQKELNNAAGAVGLSMGKKLTDALFGPETQTIITSGKGGNVEKIVMGRAGFMGFTAIGQAIGEAIATGLTTALGKGFSDWWNKTFLPGIKKAASPGIFGGTGGGFDPSLFKPLSLPGSAEGGVFTQPTLTWVAEAGQPEAVMPLSSLRAGNTMPGASPLGYSQSSGAQLNTSDLLSVLRDIKSLLSSAGPRQDLRQVVAVLQSDKTPGMMARAVRLLESINSDTPNGLLDTYQRIGR